MESILRITWIYQSIATNIAIKPKINKFEMIQIAIATVDRPDLLKDALWKDRDTLIGLRLCQNDAIHYCYSEGIIS